VPFILDGLVAGQPVMVAVIQQRIDLLRTALGPDAAAAVIFVDMAEIGRNPARIIPAWRSFLDEHGAGGRPVRGIGEPVWAGRRPAEVTECQVHEALLNLAVEPHVPLWLLCPYDVEALAADVVTEAQRSHPTLVDVDSHRPSTLYGGSRHVRTVFASDLPQVGSVAFRRELSVDALLPVRQDVLEHAAAAGVPAGRRDDLALAVHEVAANSIEHAGGTGLLRIWQDDEALVCEIRDVGRIQDPLVGRTLPAWDDEGGRGLWMANHLCDLVQVRSGSRGTTVRISTWLQPDARRARTALAGDQDRRRP
jgi:anti-sigma regulatory factor (Ser/Thr protein kinase)